MPPVIEVRNLSKKYHLGVSARHFDRLSDHLAKGTLNVWNRLQGKSRAETEAQRWFWGLEDISFDVEQGEVVGVVGANGAGKSTLLKILSRITDPTSGYGIMRGRTASLLEVGTGFHPDLTGRENIYLNGSVLGMSKAEVDAKFDEIAEFSETGAFLDTPVKRYSSGMYVRLAFAVAAHLEPEIMIVDEVLAVGDMAFQRKCLGKMADVSKSGRTILFVSHNMAAVQNLCERCLVLSHGKLAFDGSTKEAIDYYVHTVYGDSRGPASPIIDLNSNGKRTAKSIPSLTTLELQTGDGLPLTGSLSYGSALTIHTHCRLETPVREATVRLWFNTLLGDPVFVADSAFDAACTVEELVGEQVFVCEIPSLSLIPGEYMMHVVLRSRGALVDCVEEAVRLTILPSDYYGTGRVPKLGRCVLPHRWYIKDETKLLAPVDDVSAT